MTTRLTTPEERVKRVCAYQTGDDHGPQALLICRKDRITEEIRSALEEFVKIARQGFRNAQPAFKFPTADERSLARVTLEWAEIHLEYVLSQVLPEGEKIGGDDDR